MSLFLILLATVGHTQSGKCPGAAGEGLLSLLRETDLGPCGVLESLSGVQTGQMTTGGTGGACDPSPVVLAALRNGHNSSGIYTSCPALSGLLWIYLAITILVWEFP